jgi:hypothetical protein
MVGWLGQDCPTAPAPLLATTPTPLLAPQPLASLLASLLGMLLVHPKMLLELLPASLLLLLLLLSLRLLRCVPAQPPPPLLPAHRPRMLPTCYWVGPCWVTPAAALALLQASPQAAAGAQSVRAAPTCST